MRRSHRARRVRLLVNAREGLVVVVPIRFNDRDIPAILEKNRAWIERAERRMLGRRAVPALQYSHLPDRIALAFVEKEWAVEYRFRFSPQARASVRELAGQRLLVIGAVEDMAACREALLRWLQRKAHAVLAPVVADLADRHGFQVGRVSVRRQRTRWASCSRRKTISLNSKLLFLAPPLVAYVLLHELCHTEEMNHSPAFWALLESRDPDFRVSKALMRSAERMVPDWLDHARPGPPRLSALP